MCGGVCQDLPQHPQLHARYAGTEAALSPVTGHSCAISNSTGAHFSQSTQSRRSQPLRSAATVRLSRRQLLSRKRQRGRKLRADFAASHRPAHDRGALPAASRSRSTVPVCSSPVVSAQRAFTGIRDTVRPTHFIQDERTGCPLLSATEVLAAIEL